MTGTAHRLAPETDESIQSALDALGRSVQLARITNDPLLHTLEALAATVRAQHRMFVDAALMLSDGARGMSAEGEQKAARHIATETWRELRSGRFPRMVLAWLGLAAVAGSGIAFGAGYFAGTWRSDTEQLLATCQSGQVQTTASGRRFCAVWLDPPPPATTR